MESSLKLKIRMKQKQSTKKEYRTDLRIHATPHQVAASFFKNDPPRKAVKHNRAKRKASA